MGPALIGVRIEAAEGGEEHLAARAGGAAQTDDVGDLLHLAPQIGSGKRCGEGRRSSRGAEEAIEIGGVAAHLVRGLHQREAVIEGENLLERLGARGLSRGRPRTQSAGGEIESGIEAVRGVGDAADPTGAARTVRIARLLLDHLVGVGKQIGRECDAARLVRRA